jgi:hypothetical protein
MFISKVQITNYKSFFETETVLLSRGMNIVTGQNNVGKTAFLQVLGLNTTGKPHRSIKTKPSEMTPVVIPSSVDVEVTLSNGELLRAVRGEAAVYVPLPRIGVRFENVPFLHDTNPPSLDAFKKWFFTQEVYTFQLRGEALNGQPINWQTPIVPSFGLYHTNGDQYIGVRVDQGLTAWLLGGLYGPQSDEVGTVIGKRLSGLIYRFEAERFNKGTCPSGGNSILAPQAANLPEVLGILQGNPLAFSRYNDRVQEILPQVTHVSVVPENANQTLLVWMSGPYKSGRRDLAFELNECGTGIGQVLAILYVVLTSVTPQVILIDEPQSFLHPGAARKLIEVLKQYPQHQYVIVTHSPTIITSARPETILLLTHDGNESHIDALDAGDAYQLRKYLDEIGASLADVFGTDGIIWVEGTTEEKCYPLIVEGILKRSLMGKVIKSVIATGDFEGKHAERFFQIYNRLSGAQSLIPPAVAFLFDDEGRSDTQKDELRSLGRQKVHFTKRRMYENHLLDVKAITEVLNTTEGHTKTVTETEVQAYIDKCVDDPTYFKPLEKVRGIEWVRADQLLKDLFWAVAELDYRKTNHSVELTQWLVDYAPDKLAEIADMIGLVLG